MKKLLLLALIFAFAININAQTMDKKWAIGGGTGAYGTLENYGLGIIPEFYFSRYISPRFDLMLRGNIGIYKDNIISDLDFVNPFLNLRFKLSGENARLRPYLMAGPGYLLDNSVEALNFDLILGTKFYIASAAALYLEAGYIRGIESTTFDGFTGRENLWKVTAGVELNFGKAKDTDMDGVSDKKDKCPNTPTGVAVNEDGCPVDTDGDGVADYIDDCPALAGLTYLKGCPDKDGDGIADKNDDCPDVAGLANLKGCPDADGDGIADRFDNCANTPKGYKVDANGCPLDSDKDGVIDEEDGCPTVAGTIANKGCPVIVVTNEETLAVPNTTIEPVYFGFDKSNYLSGEKTKIDKLVNILKTNENLKVNLTGNADSKGTEEYNMKLTERRIDSVVKTIQSSGIPETRISKEKALGESKPAATNETEEGRALNRRVTFEVINPK